MHWMLKNSTGWMAVTEKAVGCLYVWCSLWKCCSLGESYPRYDICACLYFVEEGHVVDAV